MKMDRSRTKYFTSILMLVNLTPWRMTISTRLRQTVLCILNKYCYANKTEVKIQPYFTSFTVVVHRFNLINLEHLWMIPHFSTVSLMGIFMNGIFLCVTYYDKWKQFDKQTTLNFPTGQTSTLRTNRFGHSVLTSSCLIDI
jgi:hypothetical protein